MKPVTPKKLTLTREAVRTLNAADLTRAAGAKPDNTHAACGTTNKICP
jgi:hypothetical protein